MGNKTLKETLASKGLYTKSTGKQKEKELLKGFLLRLQLGHCNVVSHERPDFILEFSRAENSATIGLEITDYFIDIEHYGSTQARFMYKWKKLAQSIRESRCIESGF